MIEILMATYNGDAYIRQQIDSILSQTFTDWILTIGDDCSSDATLDIIREYISFYPEKIRLVKAEEPSGSAKANFVRLLQQATGEYVMFADQDDVWESDKLEKTFKAMKKLEEKNGFDIPLLVHTDLEVVDERLNQIAPSFMNLMKLPMRKDLNDLIIQNSVVGCTTMINNRLLNMGRALNDASRILMHDQALAIIAMSCGKLCFLEDKTVKYRQHGDNQVGATEAIDKSATVKRAKSGKEKFRKDMEDSYAQVQYILENIGAENVKSEYRGLLCEYAGLKDKTSKEKKAFYKKYKVYKNGFIKKTVQILWT